VFESSLSHLLSAWSDVAPKEEAKTLSGMIAVLEALPENPEKVKLIHSEGPVLWSSIQSAIRETEQDVSRLPEYSPLLDIYQIALTAYDQADELLQEILSEETSLATESESILEDLRMASGELKRSQELWAQWMARAIPRCSCCGYESSSKTECPNCGTDLLRSDARPNESTSRRQAVLGPEYNNAYGIYLKLQDGRVKLTDFQQALAPIQRNANTWRALLRQIPVNTLPEHSYEALTNAVEQTFCGISLISDAHQTRRWSHINDGWNSVFHAAVDIQEQLPELYRALGSEDEAEKLEQDMRVRDLV
jgi:hypothetical protein